MVVGGSATSSLHEDAAAVLEAAIPTIDMSSPECTSEMTRACEELGFFKVVNHGVSDRCIRDLEAQVADFFCLPAEEKMKAGPPDPFGYGNRRIGGNGDVGQVEYLLLNTNSERYESITGADRHRFEDCVREYVSAVRNMGCEILERLADGLRIQERNVFSKLLRDEESDSLLRMNHYPAAWRRCAVPEIGFGEHTDPHIISVLRSNDTSGLEIRGRDGGWMSVQADERAFFINVGDSLQVMTNGRFRSVRHRVVANSDRSRLSMIYFGGPPLSERIAPLPALTKGDEDCLYKELTWFEYKRSFYSSRLADNRLVFFEKIAAS